MKLFEIVLLVMIGGTFTGYLVIMGRWVSQDRRNWQKLWKDLEDRDREEAIRRLELQARQFPVRSPRA
jgi:hypothetical protein